ncbi:putative ABC transport system substrate-binding protein [Lactobacillus colini]|uniref:ABC transport system substrate-binding protein n=1 Tax=Lactobacillus colini TaxID=1819254 RepID=A0ABS4MG66_9LACO|nr:tryptophan ABC transporter substrate-binding protein [Lactobacillus colini]MBP2058687.1 putative ABC transport system substrate-binding protein [Lactobacillus colini]
MKKLIATIIALFTFLVIAFFVENKQKNDSLATPTVGILQTMSHPSLDEIHRGIISGLKQAGYSNNKNIKIEFENAQGDQSNLKSMSDRFLQHNAKVVIGIATPAVQSLANEPGKTPVIMGAVSDPTGTGLVKSLNQPGGKVTGVKDREPIKQQLSLIKTFMPNIKDIGVVYTSSDDSSTSEFKEFKSLAQKDGINVHAYTITSTNDIEQVAQTMAGRVQAVYVPTDNTVASGFSSLVKATNSAKIPIFPAVDSMVKSGGIATVAVSQFDMGVLTGKMAAKILKGQDPATTPVETVNSFATVVNEKAAQKLNIHIPQSIINQAKKKGSIIK